MIKVVHDCVGCPESIGCQKATCPYYNNVELICDCCGEYVDTLYLVDIEQWCADCVLNAFEKVDVDEEITC